MITGNLSAGNSSIYVSAFGTPEDGYGFRGSVEKVNAFLFPALNITNTRQMYHFCLKATPGTNSSILNLHSTTCSSRLETLICRREQNDVSVCNQTVSRPTPLDALFNTTTKLKLALDNDKLFKSFKNMFARLNYTAAYRGLFLNLWYSSLPCFDINGITSFQDGQKSLLKSCSWKGVKVACAAIFDTFPTDQGMCCSFNMKSADEIFKQSTYTKLVLEQQKSDKLSSFQDPELPDWYLSGQEPTAQAGQKKGLNLMLDAHNDIYTGGSVDNDFQGLTMFIGDRGSYPLTSIGGIKITPGHFNMIGLSATKISATDDIVDIEPKKRNCLLETENDFMQIHNKYSQSNCFLECSIFYAQKQLQIKNKSNQTCSPWYLPTSGTSSTICNPWEAADFETYFLSVPDSECYNCLPDCNKIVYEPSITIVPYRKCDYRNIGVSPLCNFDFRHLPEPWIWARQLLEEVALEGKSNLTLFRRLNIVSSERNVATNLQPNNMFNLYNETYDAYEKDISMVQIYFKAASALQFQTAQSQTWIGFLSTIGGLLGLCVGVSIVTFIELFWLCCRIGWNIIG